MLGCDSVSMPSLSAAARAPAASLQPSAVLTMTCTRMHVECSWVDMTLPAIWEAIYMHCMYRHDCRCVLHEQPVSCQR